MLVHPFFSEHHAFKTPRGSLFLDHVSVSHPNKHDACLFHQPNVQSKIPSVRDCFISAIFVGTLWGFPNLSLVSLILPILLLIKK